jgi:hypothetical protein
VTDPFPYPPLRAVALLRLTPDLALLGRGCRTIASIVGVSLRTVQRWERHGLGLFEADKAASTLGQHPSAIWPEWWDVTQDDAPDPALTPAQNPPELEDTPVAPARPAPPCRCCACTECGPQDDRANGGCEPRCLPCSFGVCACVTVSA